jgi:hypothetical protein
MDLLFAVIGSLIGSITHHALKKDASCKKRLIMSDVD